MLNILLKTGDIITLKTQEEIQIFKPMYENIGHEKDSITS